MIGIPINRNNIDIVYHWLSHLYIWICHIYKCGYGVATISRLLTIIGLFCRIQSLLQGSFAKETYNLKEPTNRSHLISVLFVAEKFRSLFVRNIIFCHINLSGRRLNRHKRIDTLTNDCLSFTLLCARVWMCRSVLRARLYTSLPLLRARHCVWRTLLCVRCLFATRRVPVCVGLRSCRCLGIGVCGFDQVCGWASSCC